MNPRPASYRWHGSWARNWVIRRWLIGGEWRAHPVRALVAIGAIAIGVALGFAVHLINAAAFNEFSATIKNLSGQSDLQVRGVQTTFDEALYPILAQHAGVALANPVLEVDAVIPGRHDALKILGIDVFRAAAMAPDLIGVPVDGRPFDSLADDAIFLSAAAMEWLKVKPGDTLALLAGTDIVTLRIAGGLTRARAGQRIAVMDIGAAQWRFQRIGQLSRIDLTLIEGVNRIAFKATLTQELHDRNIVGETEDQEARAANMSRAYRVNLNVLALVALFTGAFLVFSSQALSVIRRRQQFAFQRVMGLTRTQLLLQILLEGGILGVIGSAIGIMLGYAIAAVALHFFGGDLGGGYFPGVQPSVQFAPLAAAVFFALGATIALLGSAAPAWEAAHAAPAAALKSGSEEGALSTLSSPIPALTCLACGIGLTQLPPVLNLPLFGYLAVVLLLVGSIALMPRLSALIFSALARFDRKHGAFAVSTLTLSRLANTPNQASIALGGVLSSFSLMVAMAIMVSSFRVSVDDWLINVLSADLYVRSASGGNSGDTGGFKPDEQHLIAALPGMARADFLRVTQLTLDPDRPNVAVLARAIDPADPGKSLPLVGAGSAPNLPPGALPIWISEAMIDLYAWSPGKQVKLPLGGKLRNAVVAGVWRDYARQSGALQMRLSDYRALTGDTSVTDVGLHLQSGVTIEQAIAELKQLPFGGVLEISEPGDIRALSLKIFDRSFAVTYLLEIVAIVIGLFGIAASFSAQTFSRAKEFGMLRHIGVTRRQILGMLALEGGLLTAIGIGAGFVLGWGISLILVFIVNPQSFHWTMSLHMPWLLLASMACALLVSAALTALVSGRYAVSRNAVHAIREDW
jgi:putative ABC transport system permease protein